jgi:ketosteroid isomerase-like protein
MVAPAGPPAIAGGYFDALSAKDFPMVAGLFADDIGWHQPGGNRFSGTHRDVDLLRVEGDRIAEVWLFSVDTPAEDAFWGAG